MTKDRSQSGRPKLISRKQLAELLGISVPALDMRRQRGTLIQPDGELSNTPWWVEERVKSWIEAGLPKHVEWPGHPDAPKLVGLPDIQKAFGVARVTVDQWQTRRVLPRPDYMLGDTPAWLPETILRFSEQTHRRIVDRSALLD